jgi:hypothetical protein
MRFLCLEKENIRISFYAHPVDEQQTPVRNICWQNTSIYVHKQQNNKLRGLSTRANYTDRVTAAFRQS